MSNPPDVQPPDVQRALDHCMTNIKGASEAMADDMYDAAMRLGAAEMMLASEGWRDEQKVDGPYPRGRASSPVAAVMLVLLQSALSFLA